ncbi:hypothetical protein QEH45_gp04 [Microbacterium phage Shocker]|uniref:Acb2/Tad1 hairpin domain-containing protein n=1 Tax=Microbacterium phage Shocker TaxID=2805839 RepID=A0A890V410_9CAUD|nr:hypothetical protein QEH45_gp04 [Microbacterium phage Shocker]QRI45058.1 hypothetical protein SEA_SHOCKER_4 [Microbacterium phage Shocker]
MALRTIPASREEEAQLLARFKTAQAEPPEDIEDRKRAQRMIQCAIEGAAIDIDRYAENSREKSLALTHLEEALMWAGKAIFS